MDDGSSPNVKGQGKLLPFRGLVRPPGLEQKLLCIPCAHKNHDFKERAPALSSGALDGDHTPRAWIDGRGYAVIHRALSSKVRCAHCGEEVSVTYGPEERCA